MKEKEFGPGDSYVKVGPKEWKPTLTGMIIHEAGDLISIMYRRIFKLLHECLKACLQAGTPSKMSQELTYLLLSRDDNFRDRDILTNTVGSKT